MQRDPLPRSLTPSLLPMVVVAAFFSCAIAVRAVMPYNSATVTRVENKVDYGKVREGRSETRRANPQDVVKASDFLLSAEDSRAELKYDDGTIVRIGQNTVFSWDANTRTLKLDKGTFVFYIPKGAGGGTIKTPSMTAAITGTIGKVSETTIAIVEGEVTLIPGGEKIGKFQFARREADGSIFIGFFDPSKAYDGKLMTFNGFITGVPELAPGETFTLKTDDDPAGDAYNQPSSVIRLFPPPKTRIKVPQATGDNNNTHSPY